MTSSELKSLCTTFSVADWSAKGFSVSGGSLEQETIEELRRRADRIVAGHYETGRAPWPFLPKPGSGQDQIAMYSHVHWSDSLFNAIANSAELGAHASSLLQVPIIRLWGTSVIYKMGGKNGVNDVRWHRDMTFWQCVNHPRLLTYWIALDDTDPNNGCLEFAIGSHLVQHQIGERHDSDLERFPSEEAPMKRGQVSVHHCLTGHRSNCNHTNNMRRALTIHLMDGTLSYVPGTPSDDHMNVALLGKVEPGKIDGPYFPVIYCEY